MSDQAIRQQLINLLTVRQAHLNLDDAVKDFPLEHINTRPPKVEYTFWHLLEHLRIAQWDILDYCRNQNYKEIHWPDDYWPTRDAVTDAAGWQRTIDQFQSDLAAVVSIVQDPQTDLYSPIPHGDGGHNILREILLVADHNAYHLGEFAILRQVVGNW